MVRSTGQPPGDRAPLRVRFEQVPFADRVVFYGGLYYEHERMREGGPVDVKLFQNGGELGRMTHRDGDGWRRLSLRTSPGPGAFEVVVSARSAHRRSFCWAASVRQGAEDAKP